MKAYVALRDTFLLNLEKRIQKYCKNYDVYCIECFSTKFSNICVIKNVKCNSTKMRYLNTTDVRTYSKCAY